MGHTELFWQQCQWHLLEDSISEVTLEHETSCFYGLWTSDPICTPVGLIALWLQWGQGNWKALA